MARDAPGKSRAKRHHCRKFGVGRNDVLTDADKRAPDGGKAGADKNHQRVVAERAAISADVSAERAELMMARGVKHTRQHRQNGSSKIHRPSPSTADQFVGMPPSSR